jgi:hypothetical protein
MGTAAERESVPETPDTNGVDNLFRRLWRVCQLGCQRFSVLHREHDYCAE